MLKAIPWNIIGPALTAVIIILAIVFGFILKLKKLEKGTAAPTNPPKDINTMSKKTVCFRHEGEIASNTTAIAMIGKQLEKAQEKNSEDHGKIFQKIEDLGTKIITEIHKANGDT